MTQQAPNYRLDGVYPQRQKGFFMQRVKLPAGVLSSDQATAVADVAERYGRGIIHLTTRGSMEIHWLKEEELPSVKRAFAMAGLTSRGACGGAVRGITCASQGGERFPLLESLARRLQRHFTGNPRFEALPKKFKIGIEADSASGRHLIQDLGLLLSGVTEGQPHYDVWIAGGLGREPHPSFRLIAGAAENKIIPIIEAVVSVYAKHAPPPKRLKFLAKEFGEDKLRNLIEEEPVFGETLPLFTALPEQFVVDSSKNMRLELPVFAGQLTAAQLSGIAETANRIAAGVLMVTADQNIAMQLLPGFDPATEYKNVREAGLFPASANSAIFRICPGSHECCMGLSATREVAGDILKSVAEHGTKLTWAISGCPNSCTQPQLADVGIITSKLITNEEGEKSPRFDLYHRRDAGLGTKLHENLTQDEMIKLLVAEQ